MDSLVYLQILTLLHFIDAVFIEFISFRHKLRCIDQQYENEIYLLWNLNKWHFNQITFNNTHILFFIFLLVVFDLKSYYTWFILASKYVSVNIMYMQFEKGQYVFWGYAMHVWYE